jgi:hypothetical protein
VSDGALFRVVCRHCNATVLATVRLRDDDAQRLADHLSATHPRIRFYSPKLSLLLDHFRVQQSPDGFSE